MDHERLVAVTGIGLMSALGNDVRSCWDGLVAGRSGAIAIQRFPTANLPVKFAATVRECDGPNLTPDDRTLAMARATIDEALQQSGLTDAQRMQARLFIAHILCEVDWAARIAVRQHHVTSGGDSGLGNGGAPAWAVQRLGKTADAVHVAHTLTAEYELGAAPLSVTTACASGASAIQLAVEQIRHRALPYAIVVGTDSTVFPEGILRFALMSALSGRNESPATACRPFSKDRDGFVMGEGAAALVLESLAAARARGADILGYVLGCGDATDSFHRTRSHPSGDAIVSCMTRALKDANVAPTDIQYVNAHGTSTSENDRMECLALHRLFGDLIRRIPVSSNKSMIGHTLAAAGTVEAAISLLSMRERVIPPTINHFNPDPQIDLDVVPNIAREARARVVLSNSFGFGGQNVSIVLGLSDSL
jgi:3-oxoacyl-[acyl-carrier-protein] synthase II